MATPEPAASSRRFASAARAERERLLRQLKEQETRIADLRDETAHREAAVRHIREKLALLAKVAYDEGDNALPLERHLQPVARTPERLPAKGYLRGTDIRVAAVRILAATENPSTPIHYGDWFDLFTEAGYGIAGRDPRASFLTAISRSPLVMRTSQRGIYALDLDVPTRLRSQLHLLHRELAGLHEGQQTIDEIATVATRRAELTNQTVKIERELEEVAMSLGLDAETATS